MRVMYGIQQVLDCIERKQSTEQMVIMKGALS